MNSRSSFEFSESRFGTRLRIEGTWTPEIARVAAVADVRALSIGPLAGDLEFLRELPKIESLSYVHDGADIGPIHSLRNLRHLYLANLHGAKLDFTSFPRIEDCSLTGSTGVDSVFEARSLTRLVVSKVDKRKIERLRLLVNLHDLTIFGSDTPSLTPLCCLTALQKVRLVRFRKLLDNSFLSSLGDLRELWVQDCSGFTSLDALQGTPKLEYLNLEDVGPINTLKPLGELVDLHSIFVGGTNTFPADGDLSYGWSRPKLRRFLVASESLNWFSVEEREREEVRREENSKSFKEFFTTN